MTISNGTSNTDPMGGPMITFENTLSTTGPLIDVIVENNLQMNMLEVILTEDRNLPSSLNMTLQTRNDQSTLGGNPASQVTYTSSDNSQVMTDTYSLKNDKLYILRFIVPSEQSSTFLPIQSHMIKSFQFVNMGKVIK